MVTADALVPYDLTAPARLAVPRYSPWRLAHPSTPEGRREIARRQAVQAARDAEARKALGGARAKWLWARERLAANVPAVLVLDIHRPALNGTDVVCAHCREPVYDEAEPAPWACATYRAVTGEAG